MDELDAKDAGRGDKPVVKTKYFTIKQITGTSNLQLNTEADIDKFLSELRQKLAAQLEDGAVVSVEF